MANIFLLSIIFGWIANLFDMLDGVNNVIQFALFLFSGYFLLSLYTKPYRKPLQQILGHLGLSTRMILSLIWICRSEPRTYIRLFIELAIIKSQGKWQSKDWWKKLKQEFIGLLDDGRSMGTFVIEVDSIFQLTSTKTLDLFNRYFLLLTSENSENYFGLTEGEFVSSVRIKEGYLVPTLLIHGLQDQFDEDWRRIANKYIFTFYSEKDRDIMPIELYSSYYCMMYGPSYEVSYDDQDYKLVQYGYADDTNSVNIVIRNDEEGRKIWDQLNPEKSDRFGVICSVQGKIFAENLYFEKNRDRFGEKAQPFIDRLGRPDLAMNFLIELEKMEINNSYRDNSYYFTAFLWMMFYVEGEDERAFSPERTMIFFQTVNLPDKENYQFGMQSLIDTCDSYFTSIFRDERFKDRSYRLCLTMNEEVRNRFLEYLEEKRKQTTDADLAKRFQEQIKEDMIHAPSEIIQAFDDYFSEPDLEVVEVDMLNVKSVSMLFQFYLRVSQLQTAIPSVEEVLDDLNKKKQGKLGANNYHVILLVNKNNSEVIGGIILYYIRTIRSVIIPFIYIQPTYRGQGYGTYLYQETMKMLHKHFKKRWKLGTEVKRVFVFLEEKDESTERMSSLEELAMFWKQFGFQEVNVTADSIEWKEGKLLFSYLEASEKEMSTDEVESVIDEYLKMKHQDQHVKRMNKVISSIETPRNL